MAKTTFQFLWRDRAIDPQYRTGVSLHSHTLYSEESLDQICSYIARAPYLGRCIKSRDSFDFSRGYWTPPLPPRRAHRLEEKQIHRTFDLPALVSLTDHDDIQAGALLRVLDRFRHAPVSVEWTVPFGTNIFHIGVHNLPPSCANGVMAELRDFTANPEEGKLEFILEHLHGYPDVLLVLNHPLWDETNSAPHPSVLRSFIKRYRSWLHALELNGLRPWAENKKVIQLGDAVDLPILSGGDRHGLEPNAVLNLSQATTFAEFVHEIRYERKSHVVLMPQYREPHALRMLRMILDVLADYPQIPGRVVWSQRVFARDTQTGVAVPVCSLSRGANYWPMLLQFVSEPCGYLDTAV